MSSPAVHGGSLADVAFLAQLAGVSVEPDEVASLQHDLVGLLELVRRLQSVELTEAPAVEGTPRRREDVAVAGPARAVVATATEVESGHLVVRS